MTGGKYWADEHTHMHTHAHTHTGFISAHVLSDAHTTYNITN